MNPVHKAHLKHILKSSKQIDFVIENNDKDLKTFSQKDAFRI